MSVERDVSIAGHRILMVNSSASRDQLSSIATDAMTAATTVPFGQMVIISTDSEMEVGFNKLWLGLDGNDTAPFAGVILGNCIVPPPLTS